MPRTKVSVCYNLEELYPSLKIEWNYELNHENGLIMTKVSPYSEKYADWVCRDCQHPWTARIKNRTRNGSGCPACSTVGRAANSKNSLATRFPEIAKTWHPTLNGELKPENVRYGSKKEVYWICLANPKHVFLQGISKRTSYGKATCKICSGRKLSIDTALTATNPELITEWDWSRNTIHPSTLSAGSAQMVHWRCKRFPEDHQWSAQVKNRAKKNSGCRYCNNQGSIPEIRLLSELETLFPEINYRKRIKSTEVDLYFPSIHLALEYDGSYWHRNKLEKDRKKNQLLLTLGIDTLRVRHKPLKRIGNHDVIVNESELTKHDLDRVVRAIYLKIRKELGNDVRNYLSESGFKAEEAFKKRTSQLAGIHNKNNAAVKAPHLINVYSARNRLPLESYSFGSRRQAIWECGVPGHPDYEKTIKGKVAGEGCPYCTRKLLAPENTLAAMFPVISEDWDTGKNKIGPDQVSYGSSSKKYWWRCLRFGHSYIATVNNRTNASGCPICPKKGMSLRDQAPELEFQWLEKENGGMRFEEVPAKRKIKYWWRCKVTANHPMFLASPANMTSSAHTSSGGCDKCRRGK